MKDKILNIIKKKINGIEKEDLEELIRKELNCKLSFQYSS